MSRRNLRGATVIELLIASSLFLLCLILLGEPALSATASRNKTVDKNQVFRSGTVALGQMQRELALTEKIYSPSSLASGLYHPGDPDPMFIVGIGGDNPRVIGYHFDKNQGVLWRTTFRPEFDPAVTASQSPDPDHPDAKVVPENLREFALVLNKPAEQRGTWTVDVQMQMSTGSNPQGSSNSKPIPPLILGSKTRIRRL